MLAIPVSAGRIGPEWLGVLVPATVFAIALAAVWLLYRRFSRGD